MAAARPDHLEKFHEVAVGLMDQFQDAFEKYLETFSGNDLDAAVEFFQRINNFLQLNKLAAKDFLDEGDIQLLSAFEDKHIKKMLKKKEDLH
jgi:hypothetical protein